ncbi:MAG TPA: malonate decarboxylase holo-ACP synthase [Puia sp.]|nr:malonate decarboxylase holo-ACP synthase [Puia sp.]
MELRPHDLIRIRGAEDLFQGLPFPSPGNTPAPEGTPPPWAKESLHLAPWIVVRRAISKDGLIPVGVRGRERGLRFATWLSPDKILSVISPAMLISTNNWRMTYPNGFPQPIQSLRSLTPFLQASHYNWGPTGSVAFELATGIPSTKAASDLDLLLEMPQPIAVPAARSLLTAMETLSSVRLDIQMNTPAGAVALKEYCQTGIVLVKTALAPVLRERITLWD